MDVYLREVRSVNHCTKSKIINEKCWSGELLLRFLLYEMLLHSLRFDLFVGQQDFVT